jgi:hypothetical protein
MNQIDFINLIEETLQEKFVEQSLTGDIEMEYLIEQLGEDFSIEKIAYGYETVRGKKVSTEMLAGFHMKQQSKKGNFL